MINQSLSLTQEQRQVQILAPQLRQSLEMLQAPMLELRTLIYNELEKNPTLEEILPETMPLDVEPGGGEVDNAKELSFEKEFEVLSRIDDEWRDYFMQHYEPDPDDSSRDNRKTFLDFHTQPESLQEHLLRQLRLSDLEGLDLKIGELIIGSLDSDGYLTQPIDELADSAGIDRTHAADILSVVQDFSPVGVGARDLRECLLLQLERLGHADSIAALVVGEHMQLLAKGANDEIAKLLKVSVEEISRAANLIATLEPKPGRPFGADASIYILPEVIIEKVDGKYIVILNDDQIPKLRISKNYRRLIADDQTAPDAKDYIRNKIKAGLFLMKSIEQRKRTLRNVAEEIVRIQSDFFDLGPAGLKPLTMAAVAQKVGVHETTVSRCIANKYMRTPSGLFEMKYFFAAGLKTADGAELSNKAVQDMIASLLSEEDPAKPLSDQEITERLQRRGVLIARRTVAKYRVAMRIPPSHLRKQP